MRFSQVLARAARTEYRTPVMKHPYQPGSTFGFLVSVFYFFKGCPSHFIFETNVGRKRIGHKNVSEFGSSIDFDSI